MPEPVSSSKSRALQVSLFATGCSGIVSEFVLSTLATYLVGNATFQWTMVMSLMLFAMGMGSRYSRHFTADLFDTFVLVELLLSSLCALSAVLCFSLSIHLTAKEVIIYPLAFAIGGLIGLEIPLVTRLNSEYQELRTNISKVLEMDYFGSLLGGMLFAFVFLPYLGLSYTPVVLGSINFAVASWLLWRYFHLIRMQKTLVVSFVLSLIIIASAGAFSRSLILYSEQKKYKDTIIYSEQTQYQKIVMTRWKQDYWLYINGQEQFSTYDEERYHEPLVHPAMGLAASRETVLILGGGDGLAAREVLKYPDVEHLILVDLDPVMTGLATTHPVLKQVNGSAMSDTRIRVINSDAATFLDGSNRMFNVVIIDLPDPDSMDLMHLYSREFYWRIRQHLARGGVIITQATSPFFAKKAFLCIFKTLKSAGFSVLPLHNPIPTLGEWGWVMGVKADEMTDSRLFSAAAALSFDAVQTRYLNTDAMTAMMHFGKGLFEPELLDGVKVNTETDPILHRYYDRGAWGVY